uniref:Uncharacterized protein n=1 Tax=Plectus sambesii TaxID=2011161 RepID=A0A914X820_9BILA
MSTSSSSSIDDWMDPIAPSPLPPHNDPFPFPEAMKNQHGMVWMVDCHVATMEIATIWSRTLGKVHHEISSKQRRLFQSSMAVGTWVSFNAKYDGHGWQTVGDVNSISPRLKFDRYQASDFDLSGEALVLAVFNSYAYLWSDAVGRIKVKDSALLPLCRPATVVKFVAKRVMSGHDNETDIAFEAVKIAPYRGGLEFTDLFITSTLTAARKSQNDQQFSQFSLDAKEIVARPTDCDPRGYLQTAADSTSDLFVIYAPALVGEHPFTHRCLLIGGLESAPFELVDGMPIEIEAVVEDGESDESDHEGSCEQAEASSVDERGSSGEIDERTESDREIENIFAGAEQDSQPMRQSPWTPPTRSQPTDESYDDPPEMSFTPETSFAPETTRNPETTLDPETSFTPETTFDPEMTLDALSISDQMQINLDAFCRDTTDTMASTRLPEESSSNTLPRYQKAKNESKMPRVISVKDNDANDEVDDKKLMDSVAHVHQQWEEKMLRMVSDENRAAPPRAAPAVEYRDAWMVTGPLPLTNMLGVILTDPVLASNILRRAGIELIMAATDCLTNDLHYDTVCALADPHFHDYDDNRDDISRSSHGRNTAVEICARGARGIVTNVKGTIGFIWSPLLNDAVFIPPLLLDPQLKVGNWVLFGAEYYYDKNDQRRIRVTEYEVLAKDCLPVQVKTTFRYSENCESHGDLVVGWSPDFLRVLVYKSLKMTMTANTLYHVWVVKIKAEFGIEWRVDASFRPMLVEIKKLEEKVSSPQTGDVVDQSANEQPLGDSLEASSSNEPIKVFEDIEGVVTGMVAEKHTAFIWSPKLDSVIIPMSCSSGLQVGDWVTVTAEPCRNVRLRKCKYSALSCNKMDKPLLPTKVTNRVLFLRTKIRLPKLIAGNVIIAKSRELGCVMVAKSDVRKNEANEILTVWVKKISPVEDCEWALCRIEAVDDSDSDSLPSHNDSTVVSGLFNARTENVSQRFAPHWIVLEHATCTTTGE